MFSAPKERSGHVTLDGTTVHKCICQLWLYHDIGQGYNYTIAVLMVCQFLSVACPKAWHFQQALKITGNWEANTHIPFAVADHKE